MYLHPNYYFLGSTGHGYPLHQKEAILSNPDNAGSAHLDRQRVFKAIRVPTADKYDILRSEQATFRYMPRMSGDDGMYCPSVDLVAALSSSCSL